VQRRYRKFGGKATLFSLFQIGADDLDDIVGSFFGGFGVAGHVVADVIFHKFGHQAIDGAARGGETLEDIRAAFVFVQGAQDAFELADDFLGAIEEVQFFS